MGTRSLIQLAVKRKDGKLKVYTVIYNQFDGHFECLGATLASFLDEIVIVNGYSGTTERREANGAGDLFARIVVLLKESCELVGNFYLEEVERAAELNQLVDYVYTVVVHQGSGAILFEAEGKQASNADTDNKEVQAWGERFSGSPGDFIKKYVGDEDSVFLYKPKLVARTRTNQELIAERKQLLKQMKQLANSFSPDEIGFLASRKRQQLVALLDAIVYPL